VRFLVLVGLVSGYVRGSCVLGFLWFRRVFWGFFWVFDVGVVWCRFCFLFGVVFCACCFFRHSRRGVVFYGGRVVINW